MSGKILSKLCLKSVSKVTQREKSFDEKAKLSLLTSGAWIFYVICYQVSGKANDVHWLHAEGQVFIDGGAGVGVEQDLVYGVNVHVASD